MADCGCKIVEAWSPTSFELGSDDLVTITGVDSIALCPLHQAAPAMLRALETVQWSGPCGECPGCDNIESDGHGPDCPVGQAIAEARPERRESLP